MRRHKDTISDGTALCVVQFKGKITYVGLTVTKGGVERDVLIEAETEDNDTVRGSR